MTKTRNENVSTFNGISSMEDVQVYAKKPGGTRSGYVGFQNDACYMVKIEVGGYKNSHAGRSYETSGVESITAQLIRKIWGVDYAADIRVAKLLQDSILLKVEAKYNSAGDFVGKDAKTKVKLPVYNGNDKDAKIYNMGLVAMNNGTDFVVDTFQPYVTVVPFEINVKDFSNWKHSNFLTDDIKKRDFELCIIANILGVGDVKDENMIIGKCTLPQIIDCAATFKMDSTTAKNHIESSTLNPVEKEIIKKAIIEKFLKFEMKDIIDIVDQYKEILCNESRDKILSRIRDLRAALVPSGLTPGTLFSTREIASIRIPGPDTTLTPKK